MSRVYLSSPDVGQLEEQYVVDAIRSGWVAPLGPHVDAFEAEMAQRVGVAHAVALSSGTAALHLALISWGVGPGDYVPTSTLTFAATANAITYTGATPVFVDSDPTTGNMDPRLLDEVLTELHESGMRVPAVIPVDLLGRCANYTALSEVCDKHQVRILSDAAESLGALHAGQAAGSFGDAAVLSFNGNKIMTTSGGGMLLTRDQQLADHVRFLSTQAREPAPHYEHKEVGYNYRMSNVLAALGRAQLSRLDQMLSRRRALRHMYRDLFADERGVTVFQGEDDSDDNCWLTAILVKGATWSANELSAALSDADIESRPLWKPMHLQPIYRDRPKLVNGSAEDLFTFGLALPSGSVLADEELKRVTSTISSFLGDAL